MNDISKLGFFSFVAMALIWIASNPIEDPNSNCCDPAECGSDKVNLRDSNSLQDQATFRHPVAVVLSQDETHLFTANQKSGTLSTVNVTTGNVVDEVALGKQLFDLVRFPSKDNADNLFAIDHGNHQVIWLVEKDGKLQIQSRTPTAKYPARIAISSNQKSVAVSSIWSKQLTLFDLDADAKKLIEVERVDLSFSPREIVFAKSDSKLIVADNFGSSVGILDMASKRLDFVREFPGHNLRGIGISPDGKMFFASHQMLNELAHTVQNDVHWGLLMSNDLRWIQTDNLLKKEGNIYKDGRVQPLGKEGGAAGDPGDIAISKSGLVAVTLSGIDEIAVGTRKDFRLQRVKVGDLPTAVTIDSDEKLAYVANAFSDSISVVNLETRKQISEFKIGPQPKLTLADKGERLFFDADLSHDSWLSCQSCHTDGHTNGLLNDNLSDKSFGAPKRVLSLLGRSDTKPLAWNGQVKTFQEQIEKSLKSTMQMDEEPSEDQINAIAAFLETLTSPPALDVARDCVDSDQVARGRKLFENSLGCKNCHAPPSYTSPDVYDVGLKDQMDNFKFNPPTLRAVSQRANLFHDNRAKNLESVFREFKHQLPRELSDKELNDLLAFLRSI